MSMADEIRNKINKKKKVLSSEEQVRELINESISVSLLQYLQRLLAGEIPIDNMSDLARVYGIYKEVNNINDAMEGLSGQSTLPEINMRQERVLNEAVSGGKVDVNEEERLDVTDMSTEDVADLIRQMDLAQNKANEEAF
ncbi:terminase small subunit [Bacillus phage phiNIT1]|uniref:Uncharacterized protein n=2 Tax=Nitunavirus TaxID=1921016 RepID=U5PXJ7_BPGRA|nr:terminase small subunit [Bacillus phage phiNIT1]YP_008771418.1 terminase small subunit [Bacillus phage Grass]YP_010582035.1 terminase small subunit [Bacillus phage SPG24]UPI12813.1 hypothetical protein [Bacillus phage SBSphiJ5]UPI13303.1 hypothetical protein [Bacillus phage SBSphiJ7]AGY47317.1 hypothetical protein Grass_52 [Bacillus phage Grass]BAN59542.1 hypothetical protein [Bacillus phage phiNIT1]